MDNAQFVQPGYSNWPPTVAQHLPNHPRADRGQEHKMFRRKAYGAYPRRKTNRSRSYPSKARGRKNVSRRSYASNRATKTIIRQPSGVPDRLFVKLKYYDNLTFVSVAPAITSQVYRANSLFDPDFTNVGHQPYGFDQWSALYTNYLVRGSSIKVEVQCSVNAPGYPAIWNVLPTATTTTFSTQGLTEEQPYNRIRTIGGMNQGGRNIIRHYMSTKKFIGSNGQFANGNPNYRAAITTNPADQWFWQINMTAADLITNINQVCTVQITYYVEFYGRARPSQS